MEICREWCVMVYFGRVLRRVRVEVPKHLDILETFLTPEESVFSVRWRGPGPAARGYKVFAWVQVRNSSYRSLAIQFAECPPEAAPLMSQNQNMDEAIVHCIGFFVLKQFQWLVRPW